MLEKTTSAKMDLNLNVVNHLVIEPQQQLQKFRFQINLIWKLETETKYYQDYSFPSLFTPPSPAEI